jgi:hypothetical protein
MSFSRRLRLFLFGVVLGSVLMYFWVLKDKNIYKMPKGVIREKLAKMPLKMTTKASCQLACMQIDTASLRKAWKEAGIDFGLSKTNNKPCPRYYISFDPAFKNIKALNCTICEDFAVLENVIEPVDSCACK